MLYKTFIVLYKLARNIPFFSNIARFKCKYKINVLSKWIKITVYYLFVITSNKNAIYAIIKKKLNYEFVSDLYSVFLCF